MMYVVCTRSQSSSTPDRDKQAASTKPSKKNGALVPLLTHSLTHSSSPATTHTLAPAFTKATVIASPIPRFPPVTRAFLPSSKSGTKGLVGSRGPRPMMCASLRTSEPPPLSPPPAPTAFAPAPPRERSARWCSGPRRAVLTKPCASMGAAVARTMARLELKNMCVARCRCLLYLILVCVSLIDSCSVSIRAPPGPCCCLCFTWKRTRGTTKSQRRRRVLVSTSVQA